LNDEEEGGMRLKVFNLATGRRIMGFDNVDQHPPAAFFANGKSVVLVQFEKNFADEPLAKSRIGVLYDPATGRKQKDLTVDFKINGFGTTFSQDGRYLAVRSSSSVTNTIPESSIKVIDLSTGTLAASISGYRREVTSLMFSGDGRELFSAHPDGRLIAWDAKLWNPARSLLFKTDEIDSDLSLLPGTAFFTSSKFTKMYDTQTGKAIADPKDEDSFKTYQAVSGDGKLVMAADEGKLCFYSIPRLELRNSIPSVFSDEALSATAFALDQNGNKLAYGSDSSLIVLDAGTGKQIFHVPMPKGKISDIAFSENGRYLVLADSEDASVTSRYTINVIDTTTRSIVFKQDSDNPACAFSSDSSSIATLNRSDRLELHSVPEGRLISESKVPIQRLSKPIYLAFHPKERLLAVGTEYGIHVFNTESGVQVARLK
jgi:WD40 repeat protein